ncbi:amidohydrolase family protein [Cohnella xylanilytica]|nr:amidohydrolase family protein [Cohnella xylanilytica]
MKKTRNDRMDIRNDNRNDSRNDDRKRIKKMIGYTLALILIVAGASGIGHSPLLRRPASAPSAPAKGAAAVAPADAAADAAGIDRPTPEESRRVYDIVIRGGRVINPETKLDREGLNVAVEDGRIALVTDRPIAGERVIDAKGLVVSPGFIDNLSYDPNPVGVWNKLADGVTSNIAMHGGTASPGKWYSYYARNRTPLHFGASFFYTQARNKFALSRYDSASPEQIAELTAQAEQALNQGALGISFSLEYVPGIQAPEIVPLMRVAQRYNVPVYFHARYSDMEEPGTNLDAIRELIGYAERTGASVHVDHINSTGGTFSMLRSLKMLEEARDQGLDMTACTYPYDYWGTYLDSARFDEGWQKRFRITYKDLQIAGTSERLTEKTYKKYKKEGKLAVAYAIPEEDIRESLRSPFVMIGSDAILEPGYNNHPRASGTFARTIGLYVREHKVLSLMEAIDKMTLMPARRLEKQAPALRKKGRISRGMDADIVVFDPGEISDRSTVEKPSLTSAGIKYVLVNGQVALDEKGLHKDVRAGQPIRSEFVRYRVRSGNLAIGGGRQVPVVSYRGEDYVDAEVLKLQGYSLRWSREDRAFKLAVGGGGTLGAEAAAEARIEEPEPGELLLERGYRLEWDGGGAELLSIGSRGYMPIGTLRSFGWTLSRGEEGWRAERN